MDSGKKARRLDTFPHVRKRNSLSNKPASHGAHNAARHHASLLNNNKKLAMTLQETNCELLTYKKLYGGFHEFLTNVKLAKSKMSTAVTEFVRSFDEALLLLEFNDSEWSHVKVSAEACKNFQNQMNPIFEAVEEVSTDKCVEENNPACSLNQSFENTSDPSEPFQEEVLQGQKKERQGCSAQNNMDFRPDFQTGGAKGNDIDSNALENLTPAIQPSQAVKITKIPRYRTESVSVKRQNFFKDSKAKNKVCKQKSSEKKCEESDLNSCRRKTFVIKSNNASADNVDYLQDKEVISENELHVEDIPEDVQSIKNNKRKTFVKKSCNKTQSCQKSFPNKEDTVVNSELASIVTENFNENRDRTENEKDLQSNSVVKNKLITAENSEKPEQVSLQPHVSSLEENDKSLTASQKPEKTSENLTSEMFSSEQKNENEITNEPDADNKSEEVFENSKDLTETTDVMNKGVIYSDESQENGKSDIEFMNIIDMVIESSPPKIQKSYLESSESECELILIDEINFNQEKPAFETTPIRRHISNNKKKKFVFNAKKKKPALKKKSSCKSMHSETDNNCLGKNTEICQSDVNDMVSNDKNDANENSIKGAHFVLNEPVNKDNVDNVCSVRNKTLKKIKDNQRTSTKRSYNTEKKAKKSNKIKKSPSTDGLISVPQKAKKKKKKSEDIDFDVDVISECMDDDKFTATKITKPNGAEKNLDSNLPCTKTGENTFLVQAEIHPPPPFLSMDDLNKENEELNLQNMQVAVVLDDVLKSKNIDFLNLCDKDLLCSQSASVKAPLSDNSSNIPIDPEESIETLRSDAVLDTGKLKRRRQKAVCYKEPPLNRKMRRC